MSPDPPATLKPRNTVQGRPRTSGFMVCARCGRSAGKHRVTWPDGRVCGTCYCTAMRTRGICPTCGENRILPGPPAQPGGPVCAECCGIVIDFRCEQCGFEGESYRRGICARCALRNDLTALLLPDTADQASDRSSFMNLVEVLSAAGRPESILTWKRSPAVHHLLTGLATGQIPFSHEGFDALDPTRRGKAIEHLRALLVQAEVLPARDPDLAAFEGWIEAKLAPLPPAVAQPVEQFARWHHLHRIRKLATQGPVQRSVHSAKQEITETARFLSWLHDTHQRTAATCTQHDVDLWIMTGPTTRSAIRTFLVVARRTGVNRNVVLTARQARTQPMLTQEQRLGWIRELLTGTSESLSYRVAGTLLLLFAQPLVRIVAMTVDAVPDGPDMRLRLGRSPVPVPEPFARLLRCHLQHRPNLNTGAGTIESPWLFPSTRAGQHLHPNTVMDRLRDLGIDLRAARSRALTDLVSEIPPPIVAQALGYSYQVSAKHAMRAGDPWARYVASRNRHA